MGQYLAIGLAIAMSVDKKEVEMLSIDLEELRGGMGEKFHYNPEIYDLSETGASYKFTLNEDVLRIQLIPFLEEIYPHLYDDSSYYQEILKKLKTTPSSEWLSWADKKPEQAFQSDQYGLSDYLKKNRSYLSVHTNHLALSMEGKISMETFGRQFGFFKYTMMQTFKQFSLAGALRVYITG